MISSLVEDMARAIWREDHYDPKLCSCDGGCAYCEPHDDDTADNWPTDKERVERQATAALQAVKDRLPADDRELVERARNEAQTIRNGLPQTADANLIDALADRIIVLSGSLD